MKPQINGSIRTKDVGQSHQTRCLQQKFFSGLIRN